MKQPFKPSKTDVNLIRRYLIWCYKTTKEDLDRIDRYYTQLKVDQFILKQLINAKEDAAYQDLVNNFEKYMAAKKENVDKKKFSDPHQKILDPQYKYLRHRLSAIEKAIQHFLGSRELVKINVLYEVEMTRRILEAREHT